METTELLKIAAEPHLVTSAEKANEILARLQALISDLRLEVNELELKSDLLLNNLLKADTVAIERTKAFWKTTPDYCEWRTKKSLLSDVRAVRRNMERHADLLIQQQKYTPRGYERVL